MLDDTLFPVDGCALTSTFIKEAIGMTCRAFLSRVLGRRGQRAGMAQPYNVLVNAIWVNTRLVGSAFVWLFWLSHRYVLVGIVK